MNVKLCVNNVGNLSENILRQAFDYGMRAAVQVKGADMFTKDNTRGRCPFIKRDVEGKMIVCVGYGADYCKLRFFVKKIIAHYQSRAVACLFVT